MSRRGIPRSPNKKFIRKTTRIVYSSSKPGFIESNPILLGSEICVVQIDKTNKVFRVIAMNAKSICFTMGNGKDVDECKRNARKKLIDSGACILDEVRVRR